MSTKYFKKRFLLLSFLLFNKWHRNPHKSFLEPGRVLPNFRVEKKPIQTKCPASPKASWEICQVESKKKKKNRNMPHGLLPHGFGHGNGLSRGEDWHWGVVTRTCPQPRCAPLCVSCPSVYGLKRSVQLHVSLWLQRSQHADFNLCLSISLYNICVLVRHVKTHTKTQFNSKRRSLCY